ncbi:MAG: hypothetical protein U5K74_14170 [Gemmatimonadaceae bacterium]|nr:hypothetical protein [Gemmatimonadaceae bacterium]
MSLRLHAPRSLSALLPIGALLLAGCGGASTRAPAPSPAPSAAAGAADTARAATTATPAAAVPPVFGEYATRMVVVFPAQNTRVTDSGWLAAGERRDGRGRRR